MSQSNLNHIGVILDGNRRWAKQNGKSVNDGHREGYKTLKRILKGSRDKGVKWVSVYAFSTENWKRAKSEVKFIMDLLKWVVENELDELHEDGFRIRFLGSRDNIDESVLKLIDHAEHKTRNNENGALGICFNYGGRKEIVDAVNSIEGEVSEESIANHLYASEFPDVDLMIRTSGEQRISNFMLWRIAYAELYFTDKMWPDFTIDDLNIAIDDYNKRKRRYGS